MLSAAELQYHLRGCTQNKRESQKKIYSSFYSYARSVCHLYARADEDVAEILNEGFLKVFIKIVNFKPSLNTESFFKVWLRKIMIDKAIDYCYKNYEYKMITALSTDDVRIPAARETFSGKI